MKRKSLLIVLCIYAFVLNAQTFNRQTSLNLQVTENTTIYPFDGNNVTGIGVSGSVYFTSELGFVRFVVCDDNDDEYLVYESYRLFEQDSTFSFSQKCEESCFYYNYKPTQFKIYVNDAVVTINTIDMSNTEYQDAENRRIFAARDADNLKLSAVQNYIAVNGLIWVADHTKMSDLTYSEKVLMLGEGFRTYGYEYYTRGIYSMFGPGHINGRPQKTGQYVANFDWRNRHGANDPNSPYFDGDIEDGTGWISPLKCQDGCWKDGVLTCSTRQECAEMGGEYRSVGTCWIFSATACVEAMANLYYNQHLDLDLAEQYISCAVHSTHGGYISTALNHYKQEGVPYESEWPYIASLDSCDVYTEPLERVRITNYSNNVASNLENLQQALMTRGPVAIGFNRHGLLLIGWGTIDETTHNVLGYPENDHSASSFYGLTYLIYKDSFGQTSDPNNGRTTGYVYTLYQDIFGGLNEKHQVEGPIIMPDKTEEDVQCYDMDGDGYYYWGIGPKPAHCPPCPDEPDGDDSNPALGPLNTYGQCTIIDACNFSFENGWDGWTQGKFQGEDGQDWWRHMGPTETCSTGPTSAQDGDYYIYVDGSTNTNWSTPAVVLSPFIDFSRWGNCGYCVDFYYHMKVPSNNAKLYILLKKKALTLFYLK